MHTIAPKPIHVGRNIRRIRELKGIKQDALAAMTGESQQNISKLEQSEDIEEAKLQKIASALDVSADTIRAFQEDMAIHNINNTFHESSIQNQFNPIEKVVELFERLLAAEKEKNKIYEEIIAGHAGEKK